MEEMNCRTESPSAETSAKVFIKVTQRQRLPDPVVHDGRGEFEKEEDINEDFVRTRD